MYQTLYDEPGLAGIGERCAALIERCAPRMMVAGGGGLAGLWQKRGESQRRNPGLSEEVKEAIRAEWRASAPARTEGVSSRQILEAIAVKHDVHYQTVCRITREMRGCGCAAR